MLEHSLDVRIRKGHAEDARPLARLFKESWLLAYRGIIPQLHLDNMIRRRGPDWWRGAIRSGDSTLVLEVCGKLAGYATFGPSRIRGNYQGEIYELYLDPAHQGLGFGEYLFEACRHGLDQRRLAGLIVWALVENSSACAFYWRRGGRPIASTVDSIGGAKLERVAFAWS